MLASPRTRGDTSPTNAGRPAEFPAPAHSAGTWPNGSWQRPVVAACMALSLCGSASAARAMGLAPPRGPGMPRRTLRAQNASALPDCSPRSCFDASRCGAGRTVYVYPQENLHLDAQDVGSPYYGFLPREPALDDPLYTQDPSAACLLATYVWQGDKDYSKLPELPYWNGGQNHLVVDFSDKPFDYPGNASPDILGSAALAKSYMLSSYYRPGYDLALPILHVGRVQGSLDAIVAANLAAQETRKYLLAFKGSTYRPGTPGSYRWKLAGIGANRSDVSISLQCFKLHGWHELKEFREVCRDLDTSYAAVKYLDTFNTTFGLVPGGRQPCSYRLMEVMAAGAVPVFFHPETQWVRPYAHRIDWHAMSLTFRPDQADQILDRLAQIGPARVRQMRQQVRAAYSAHFGDRPWKMGTHLFEHAFDQLLAPEPARYIAEARQSTPDARATRLFALTATLGAAWLLLRHYARAASLRESR